MTERSLDSRIYGTDRPLTENEQLARSEFEDGYYEIKDLLETVDSDGETPEHREETETVIEDMLIAAANGRMTTAEVVDKLDDLRQFAETQKCSGIGSFLVATIAKEYQKGTPLSGQGSRVKN